jgi:prepilin-type N-terminal cleavage/methylation domain-containing protein/prepilin-type processing-associated H-X9-DG protein
MSRYRIGRLGFTLVELLVVIGIIALLLALLLPAIGRARMQAQIVVCMANQRSMFYAARQCMIDHNGNFAVVGNVVVDPTKDPMAFGQMQRRFILFTGRDGQRRPAPATAVIGYYMGIVPSIDTRDEIEAMLPSRTYLRIFQCPADSDPPAHWVVNFVKHEDEDILEPVSYGFNDYICGRDRFDRIWHPADIAFFMDINPTKEPNRNQQFVGAWQGASLWDIWDNNLIPSNQALRPGVPWDKYRHGRRINVTYADGHTETAYMPPDDFHRGDFGRISMSRNVYGPDPPDSWLP